jgi:hypothetical protein
MFCQIFQRICGQRYIIIRLTYLIADRTEATATAWFDGRISGGGSTTRSLAEALWPRSETFTFDEKIR